MNKKIIEVLERLDKLESYANQITKEINDCKKLLSSPNRERKNDSIAVSNKLSEPTLNEFLEYAKKNNINTDVEACYNHFKADNWKDTRGRCVKNRWQVKLKQWKTYGTANKNQTKTYEFNQNDRKNINTADYFTDIDDLNDIRI